MLDFEKKSKKQDKKNYLKVKHEQMSLEYWQKRAQMSEAKHNYKCTMIIEVKKVHKQSDKNNIEIGDSTVQN